MGKAFFCGIFLTQSTKERVYLAFGLALALHLHLVFAFGLLKGIWPLAFGLATSPSLKDRLVASPSMALLNTSEGVLIPMILSWNLETVAPSEPILKELVGETILTLLL